MRLLMMMSVATLLGGCGPADNDLWGSIDVSYPLEFDRVDILKQNAALRIEYIKKIQGGEDKVCKVVVNTTNLDIKPNSDLREEAFVEEIVTVERVAATGGEFPPISQGSMHFDDWDFKEGGHISGDFTVVFDNGRNLFGNFDGKVKLVPVD